MHRRQTRSSTVTVSACTVARLPKLERLPHNGAGANQSNESSACSRPRRYAFLFCCQNLKFTAEWEDANQSNESSTCLRVWTFYCWMVRMPVLDERTWWETYLSWRDGEPLSFVSSLKLMVVKSKEGIGLKRRKWLPFPPNCYHFGLLSATRWPELVNIYMGQYKSRTLDCGPDRGLGCWVT